jgi:hypothetical protein
MCHEFIHLKSITGFNFNFLSVFLTFSIFFYFFLFFENHLSLIHERSRVKLLQHRTNPKVSVAKLQRYQRHIRRITIQALKTDLLTYD